MVVNDRNRGVSYSRNVAVKLARGRYIAICDGDDINRPNRFAVQLAYMRKHPDADCLVAKMSYPNAPSEIKSRIVLEQGNVSRLRRNAFGRNTGLPFPTFFCKREVLADNPLDERLRNMEDWDFFIRTVPFYDCRVLSETLVTYTSQLPKPQNFAAVIRFGLKWWIENFANSHFYKVILLNLLHSRINCK